MIRKFGLPAALFLAAVPALAQQPQASQPQAPQPQASQPQSGPPPALEQASAAFGRCVSTGVQNVAATVTPEAGATAVLGGCAAERQRLDLEVEAVIATLPEERKAAAREHVRTSMTEAETQIVAAIRQRRAAPAEAPAQ